MSTRHEAYGRIVAVVTVLILIASCGKAESTEIDAFSISALSLTSTPVPPMEPPIDEALPTVTPLPSLGVNDHGQIASLGDTWVRPANDMVMVYVPAGTFQMGSTDAEIDVISSQCEQRLIDRVYCERGFYKYESPQHSVTLGGFWIDRTEVTNAQYTLCVDDGDCRESHLASNPIYNGDDYPVAGIPWQDAANYCTWTGGRLPTEAEWEYAARGTEGRVYPWGDTFDCAGGNFGDNFTECGDGYINTAPVGSFPDGVSWCGALDMAGNVWEWVLGKYGDYVSAAQINPTGPTTGELYVLRGGSWGYGWEGVRTAYRYPVPPSADYLGVGFRCVTLSKNGPSE